MRNKKLYQIGLTLCAFCLSFFEAMYSDIISIIFFGEPEFPQQSDSEE